MSPRSSTPMRPALTTFLASVMLAVLLVPIPPAPAFAAEAGDLLSTFGTGGATTFGPTGVTPSDDLLVTADGKIVVTGSTSGGDIFVGRLTAAGAQDGAFNGSGWFTLSYTQAAGIQSAALLPDGRILVAGWRDVLGADGSPTARDAFVARFTADGVLEFARDLDVASVVGGVADYQGNNDEARSIAVIDVAGTTKILLGGTTTNMGGDWEPLDRDHFVARLNLDGSLDSTFGTNGVRAVNLTPILDATTPSDDWANDLAVLADGRIVVAGFANDSDIGVVRMTSSGGIDDTFGGGDGIVVHDTAGGLQDGARSIVVGDDGTAIISGYQATGSGNNGVVVRLLPNGDLDGTFGATVRGELHLGFEPDVNANAGSLALDATGRALLAGQNGTTDTRLGVARIAGSTFDPTFSTDGLATYPCASPGGGTGIVEGASGRILAVAECGGRATVVALHSAQTGPAVANVALSLDPQGGGGSGETKAGAERVTIDALDPADLAAAGLGSAGASAQAAPMRNTPMRNTPMRNTPMRNTPMRNTPMRNTPMRNTPILLSSIPLSGTTWETLLAGTPYAGAPLTTVTLLDVLELDPSPVDGLSIEQLDLRNTPMRNTSLAGLLLGQIPLNGLPAPAGGWCDFLAGQPRDCTNGVDTGTSTLFELELWGDDLSAYYAHPIPLAGLPLVTSTYTATLATIALNDVLLEATPLAGIPGADVASLLSCSGPCPATLLEAQTAQAVLPGATIGDLLALGLPTLSTLTLGELIPGLLGPGAFPYENVPLDAILDDADIRSVDVVGVDLTFDADCVAAPVGLTAEIALGHGYRVVPGTAALTNGGSATAATIELGPTSGTFIVDLANVCAAGGGVRPVVLSFDAEAGTRLGWSPDDARAEVRWTDPASSTAPSITVLGGRAMVLEAHETYDDSLGSARPATPGALYTGHLSFAGDVDLFAIPAPPAGSRLTVSLSHLPADYDLVLYGPDSGIETTPMRNTPMRNTPMRNTGLPDAGSEDATDDTHLTPDGLQDVPMRNTPMRNTSINRGTDTESTGTTVREADQGGTFYAQVSGFDGAHSDDPYVLRVSTDPAPPPLPCIQRNYTAMPASALPTAVTTDHETLILVNPSRLSAVYPDADVAGLMTQLSGLAADPLVKGLVVPVDADPAVNQAYGAWDADPCNVSAANDVVGAINALVDGFIDPDGDRGFDRPELRHLVIVGGDEIIPQGRVEDGTYLGNESEYAREAVFGDLDNPVSRAVASGYYLSDDPYGDLDPVAWQNGERYVPDLALGRLVETPQEILATVNRFLATDVNGQLDPTTSFVSGYDFLKDGAQAVQDGINAKVANGPTRIDETWDSVDALNGIVASAGGLTSVNAHYDHYRALPAQAFNTNGPDVLATSQLGTTSLMGSILFTMGCHAGLNVMDVFVTGATGEAERAQDWAQATSSRGGLFVGNTGAGYGDTDVVAYSERLMADFAANVASGTMTVGQALMYAKQAYVADLAVVGAYDAKVVEQATFYGLPMFRIGTGGTVAAPALPTPPTTNDTTTVNRTTAEFDVAPTLAKDEDGGRGTYWTADGESPQVSHYRPIQPRTTLDVPIEGTQRAHGALIESLSSSDMPDVDPVYARPTIDLSQVEAEPVVREVAFPSTIQRVVNTATPAGPKDTLVLVPGQFFTPEARTDGSGVQRLWTRIRGTVYRSDSSDFDPPVIASTDAFVSGPGVQFVVNTPSADADLAVVLWRDDVSSTWRRTDLSEVTSGRWSGGAALANGATEVREYFVQVRDAAGNVGSSTNKGFRYRSDELPPARGLEIALDPPAPEGGYFATSPTITVTPSDAGAPTIEYRVDGGAPTLYVGPFALGDIGEGPHVVEFTGDDGSQGTVLVVIDASAPEVTITSPAEGARYEVGGEIVPEFSCTDGASGVASCVADLATVDTSRGTHTFSVTARDRAGHVTTRSVTYHVEWAWEGFFSPVHNDVVNEAKAGSAVPVKFRLRGANGTVATDTSLVTVTHRFVDCDSGAAIGEVSETMPTAGSSGLSYDEVNQQFVYVYKSAKSWASQCSIVSVTFDNASHEARFSWRR